VWFRRPIPSAAGLFALVLLGFLFSPLAPTLTRNTEPHLLFLASLIGVLDFYDFLMRIYFRRRHTRLSIGQKAAATSLPLDIGDFSAWQVRLHLKPYAVVVSVHNAEDELDDFLESVEPYRSNLWVIDDASTDETFLRLQQAGLRCLRAATNRKKPGALKELVSTLDSRIETVVVLDPDSRIVGGAASATRDLERVIFEFQRSRMAAVCPHLTIRQEGLLGLLQGLEYSLAFGLGRKSLRDLSITSGIAIYRRDALERVLERHTLSVYAEDLENALLLLGEGERIYYDGRLIVETAGKHTLKDWFSQRVGWYYGLLKVYTEKFPDVERCARSGFFFNYQFLVSLGGFSLLLHPFKILTLALLVASAVGGLSGLFGLDAVARGMAAEPAYFLFAYLQYTGLALLALFVAAERGSRLRLLPAVPLYFFYSIFQIVPITVGYLNWLSLRVLGRRVYGDHFQDEISLQRDLARGRS
jgi:cellulose synthase/poly-beta-1,6-N-acetylglucosamine synthase-like glycosyltransferase